MVAANKANVVPTRDASERLRCPPTATAAGEIFDRRDVKRCDGVNVAVSIDHRDGVLPTMMNSGCGTLNSRPSEVRRRKG